MAFKELTFAKLLKITFETAANPAHYELHENVAEVIADFFNSSKANDERLIPLLTGHELSRAFPGFLKRLSTIAQNTVVRSDGLDTRHILDSDELFAEGFGRTPGVLHSLVFTLKKMKDFNGFFINKSDSDELVNALKKNLSSSMSFEVLPDVEEAEGQNTKQRLPGLRNSKHPLEKKKFGKKNFQTVQILESLAHLDDAIVNLSLLESGIISLLAVEVETHPGAVRRVPMA